MGKRTKTAEFSNQHRGGKGVKCYRIIPKTGELVCAKAVSKGDEILMITTEGVVIRIKASTISKLGRITSGVKVMNLANGVTIAGVSKVIDEESREKEKEFDNQLMMSFFED